MVMFARFLLLLLFPLQALAEDKIVNVYAWSGEIPDTVVRQFEKATGIRVNLSTYDNNEIMYAKLRANKHAGYDVVNPSSYFVDRMRKQGMLEKLDKSKLPNVKYLDPAYLQADYDKGMAYSLPHVSGVTGIFVNTNYYATTKLTKWADLWDARYDNKLMLLNDTREVFSMALLMLGFSANDQDPAHIKAAYLKLKALMRNVKVFSSETVTSIIIDEDATLGMAWNGDVFKAAKENPSVAFIFPQEGFVIWVDNLVIPENAPHKENAYAFINFMMRPEMAKEVALSTNFSTANLAAQALLPPNIRQNPTIYPPPSVLRRGQFQTDVSDETASLLEKYWEELKMGG
jgi:spermidine/putrescine transport system substrate-binding protein